MSTQPKLGVELELWVVDEHGRLADSSGIVESHERVEPEFVDPLVEVRTAPHAEEADLRRDLQGVLETALETAAADGRHLVPLGTPLTATDAPATTERGAVFEQIYGEGIRSAKNCAGTHVHFEQDDVLQQLRLLTALDPALALVSSSPYYRSERGMDSARAHAYRTDCGERFRRYCGLWQYPDSVAEWRDRVDNVFETFCDVAAERGVSRSTVCEHFSPEDTVLNPVRLRECQPTVEWRAPDATLPSEVLRLATDVGDLVGQLDEKPLELGEPGVTDDRIGVPAFSELRELSERSIRGGTDSAPVRSYLQSMGLDVTAYEQLSEQLRGPPTISESRARRVRLRYAARLREDVESLTRERSSGPRDGLGPQTA